MKEAAADSQLHRINNALKVGTLQMKAEVIRKSPEWKALEKEMKRRKWSKAARMRALASWASR